MLSAARPGLAFKRLLLLGFGVPYFNAFSLRGTIFLPGYLTAQFRGLNNYLYYLGGSSFYL